MAKTVEIPSKPVSTERQAPPAKVGPSTGGPAKPVQLESRQHEHQAGQQANVATWARQPGSSGAKLDKSLSTQGPAAAVGRGDQPRLAGSANGERQSVNSPARGLQLDKMLRADASASSRATAAVAGGAVGLRGPIPGTARGRDAAARIDPGTKPQAPRDTRPGSDARQRHETTAPGLGGAQHNRDQLRAPKDRDSSQLREAAPGNVSKAGDRSTVQAQASAKREQPDPAAQRDSHPADQPPVGSNQSSSQADRAKASDRGRPLSGQPNDSRASAEAAERKSDSLRGSAATGRDLTSDHRVAAQRLAHSSGRSEAGRPRHEPARPRTEAGRAAQLDRHLAALGSGERERRHISSGRRIRKAQDLEWEDRSIESIWKHHSFRF